MRSSIGSRSLPLSGFIPCPARASVHSGRQDKGRVLVLVPSHHEGEGLVDTVRTLIDQDYEGSIEVQVLVQDFSDETVDALACIR